MWVESACGRAVLGLLVEGCSDRDIAEERDISEGTVKVRAEAALYKFGAELRVVAAVLAVEWGFGR